MVSRWRNVWIPAWAEHHAMKCTEMERRHPDELVTATDLAIYV